MTRYLISFDAGAMTVPAEEMPDVAKAANEVLQEAEDAGVWVFGGVSAFALATSAVFELDGLIKKGDLDECKPR